jgi:hypothetical protein
MRNFSQTALSLGILAGILLGSPAWPQLDERAALRAVAQTRIQEVLDRRAVRKVEPAVVARDARRVAKSLTDEQLHAIAAGEDVEPILDAAVGVKTISASALGDATSDLVFVPLPPCRIIDTRKAGGKMLPGVVRDFQVAGTDEFLAQGGNAGGCGVPDGAAEPAAAAVMINFFAVNPEGSGNLRAWPYGESVPLAAAITYDNLGQFFSITNGLIVPIAGTITVPADLSIRADFSATHVAADVTGYFTRFPMETFQNAKKSITTVSEQGSVDLSDGLCKEVNSCTITSGAAGKVIVRTWSQIKLDHATNPGGGGDRIAVGVKNSDPTTCSNNDQSINATDFEVPDSLPADPDVDWTLSHKRIYSQAKGTRTYYINAKVITGAGPGDRIENSRMVCTFIPD